MDMNAKHLMARGKAAHGWVEGYFLPQHPLIDSEGPMIYTFPEGQPGAVSFAVDPETVCACSGLTDMTGRLIYEQDILLDPERKVGGIVEYSEEDGMFALLMRDGTLKNFGDTLAENYEIEGNGIDNPDYLNFV